jgi:hypothetical protein
MSSAVSKVTLNGDGVQTKFPFAFKVWKAGDLEVSITSPTGANTVVTDWTVELGASGGTVTYPTLGYPLPLGWKITIRRSMDFLQDVDLVSGTRFDPEVIETALDIAAAERQQLLEEISRAVRVGVASAEDPANVVNQVFEARDAAQDSAGDAAAQVVLCQGQVQLAVNQVSLAEGWADDAEQSALDAIAAVNSAAFTNLPIGTLVWHTGTTAFPGSIVADGELRSRAAFPDLWAFAQASGNISADDASWTAGQYSPGDGSTTFRVPKVDDRFIRGKSSTRAVGLVEEDAIRNITGEICLHGATEPNFIAAAFGAFASTGGSTTQYRSAAQITAISGAPSKSGVVLDASTTVPTADENRPKNVAYLMCIKAYDTISDVNVLNAVGVVNDIERKLNRDEIIAPGDAPMYVCRAWVNFDGTTTPPTIRASGNVSSVVRNGTGSFTINFHTDIQDINYAVAGSSGNLLTVGASTILQSSVTINTFSVTTGATINSGSNHVVIFR